MVCKYCGAPLEPGTKFCDKCGAQVEEVNTATVNVTDNVNNNQVNDSVQSSSNQVDFNAAQPQQATTPAPATAGADATKVSRILSYIGILFLVGMLGNHKDDSDVRFHVGQGIILFILDIIFVLIQNFVVPAIFKKEITFLGYDTGEYVVSGVGLAIDWVLWLVILAFMVIGIMNAVKNEKKPLPLIGSLAFYK